jgi:hypothetical protein
LEPNMVQVVLVAMASVDSLVYRHDLLWQPCPL